MIKVLLFGNNVPLYNTYDNPIRFKDITERNTFFTKYDSKFNNVNSWTTIAERNISYGNGLNVEIVLPLDSSSGYAPEDIDYGTTLTRLEPNYLCIRYFDESETPLPEEDRFYFINNLYLVKSGVIKAQCELDIFTTFLYNTHYKINGKVFAERKHCDRFIAKDDKYLFSVNDTIIDDFNTNNEPNVLENTYEPIINNQNLTDATNEYLKDKKFLVIVSTEPLFDKSKTAVSYTCISGKNGQALSTSLFYTVLPLFDFYVGDVKVDALLNTEIIIQSYNEKSNIINATIIPINIFNKYASNEFYYDETNDKFIINYTPDSLYYRLIDNSAAYGIALYLIPNISYNSSTFNIFNEFDLLDKNTLVDRDMTFEPKLHKLPFRKLVLNAFDNNFEYDKLLLNSKQLKIKNYVLPNASNCNAISHLDTLDTIDDKYVNPYSNAIYRGIGCINTINKNINILNDKWQQYVTNNKNWQSLQTLGVSSKLLTSVASGVTALIGVATGNPLMVAGGALGFAGGIANATMQGVTTDMQFENIKSQPDEIKMLQNDAYISQMIYEIETPKVFEYKANDVILEKAYDFYFKNGYKVSKDISFTEFFNRQRFNYIKINDDIKCKVQFLKHGFSKCQMNANIIKKFNDILNRGVTLWNVCDEEFNTEYENWEVSLDNAN